MNIFDLTGATSNYDSQSQPTGFNGQGCNVLYVINMSSLCLNIEFTGGPTPIKGHIPNNYARPFKVPGLYDRYQLTGSFNPLGVAQPAFSHLVVESYLQNEDTSHLADTSISVPAPVTSGTVTVAQQLQNDGNPNGTNIIESTPSGQGSSATSVSNDGLWLLKVLVAGVYHQFLKTQTTGNPLVLGQAGDILEALGQLKVDQAAEFVAAVTHDSTMSAADIATFTGNPAIVADSINSHASSGADGVIAVTGSGASQNTRLQSANTIALQVPGGSNVIVLTSSAVTFSQGATFNGGLSSTRVAFNQGSFTNVSPFSGTGSGTFATGIASGTVFQIICDPCTVSGSSQTIGLTKANSSVVTTGAGLAWTATAYN